MLEDFKAWAASPFRSDMSALGWFAFAGLVIVIIFAWGSILKIIKEAS